MAAATGAFILHDLRPGTTSAGTVAGTAGPSAVGSHVGAPPKQQAAPAPAALEPEYPVAPYISKQIHLDSLPWNSQSFYKQPWRAYLETVSGQQLLSGIGVNYNLPGNANHDAVIKLLSDSGFKSIRLEVGWGNVDWSETTLTSSAYLQRIFAACKRYGVTPLILLNANQGIPCPNQAYQRTVVEGGGLGSLQLHLDDVTGLVPGRSGLSNVTASWMAEVIFTRIDGATKSVQLSKPLPKALPPGSKISVHTLKYLPLYPAATSQFNETAAGWLKYVGLVMKQLSVSGQTGVDVEIWNELTFGSLFLTINNYYQPAVAQFADDWLRPGGQCWELARRTVDFLRANYPGTKAIWGFSNTTFFHTAVAKLPPNTDGQSYHPYGTSKRLIPKDFPPRARYAWYIEHYIPSSLTWCMPEGWAHLGVQTEFLPRLINPVARAAALPPGTSVFRHYMTEHGFSPKEAGITDRHQALSYKAKSAIRALLFWLNKGISRLEVYSAYDPSDLNMGMLFALPRPKEYGGYIEQQLMSPVLQAIKNVTSQFAGAQPMGQIRQLAVEVAAIGKQPTVFGGDASHPPLYYREMFTFLPFQVNPQKFVCAIYVMSYDITSPPPPMTFRVWVRNVKGTARVSYYDPILNESTPVSVLERQSSSIRIQIQAVEYPRLLILSE